MPKRKFCLCTGWADAKLVTFARQRGSTKAASNTMTRWVSDVTLPFFLKQLANSSTLDWLYAYDVHWQMPVEAR